MSAPETAEPPAPSPAPAPPPAAGTGAGAGAEAPPAAETHRTGAPGAAASPSASASAGADGSRVCATARLVATANGRGGTALPLMSSAGPLALRHTRGVGGEARVTVVGAMSAPLGGDRLALHTRVEAGARLSVDAAAATIALPGRTGERAHYDVRLAVDEDARLRWLPEPLITAAGSDLRQTVRVDLAAGARIVLRDEQVLGRSGEPPGRLTTRLTVRRAGLTLLDQELAYGPGVPGWDSGAVLGGHRAVGQLLVVDPDLAGDEQPGTAGGYPAPLDGAEGAVAVTPLPGPAVLVTAVAPDALQLRRLLNGAGTFTSW